MEFNSYQKYRTEIDQRCQRFADKTAITYMRDNGEITETTFAEMLKGHKDLVRLMTTAGVVAGDRAAIIAPHSPQSVLAALGLAYANITAVLIDASLPASEINRLLSYSDVQACFVTDKLYNGITTELKNAVPFFELCSRENEYRLFEGSVSTPHKEKTPDPEKDVIAILFSSGTTAQMKGIKITYASVMKASEIFIRNVQWKPEYSYLHVFPLNHIAGYATVQAFLSCGSELGMIENMTAAKLQDALLKYEPHGFGMIPKVFEMMEDKIRLTLKQKGLFAEKAVLLLMSLSSFLRKNFGCMIGRRLLGFVTKQVFGKNIVAIGTGASLCRPSTSKFFLDLGLYWTNNYASTETNVPAASTGNFDRYPVGMAGKANRNPEIDIKINAPNKDGVGEIYVKSQLLMKGYFRDEELTRQSYDGEYFKTGDYGYIDKKGNLFVTGRVKESILLHSGKKVSPTDVENFYESACGNIPFACCGYPKEDSSFDGIHLFVQTKGQSINHIEDVIQQINTISAKEANLYRLDAVHKIDEIPMTSVGKVKRFELQRFIKGETTLNTTEKSVPSNEALQKMSVEQGVIVLITRVLQNGDAVQLESNLQYDVSLDSLRVLELDILLQDLYGVSTVDEWLNFSTVADLVDYIKTHLHTEPKQKESYPLPRTDEDIQKLKAVCANAEQICDFEYIGLENIPADPCLFAPNHSSHLDTVAIYKALSIIDERRLSKMCCLAAKELMENTEFKSIFKAIGAVPVDRKVNSAAALKTLQNCIAEEDYSALIYPEGTRTRTGNIGKFFDGVAIISSKTGVPIVPVGIVGAFEIWPPQCDEPKSFSEKRKITIKFGKPIDPHGYEIKQMTEEIKKSIIGLCEKES
ncbi:MAG: AMP-binding protein [Oscillospiraceae bacterium]|nr:AMP-binding protein [Oscillospiraceae bacterium]